MYNILIGCDQSYYDTWARTLLGSIQHYATWVSLHCHIVNPSNTFTQLDHVSYTTEERDLSNPDVFNGYLQAVRFLKAYELFPNNEPVIIVDTDSICTRSFTKEQFDQVHLNNPVVLYKEKTTRWLAGCISMGANTFRKDFYDLLMSKPIEEWSGFWDQTCLKQLSNTHNFIKCPPEWMSIGKLRNSHFLTLKGEQKETEKFLGAYRKIKTDIQNSQSSD